MNKINKPAGFWIRFLARLIDLVIVLVIIVGTAFAFLTKSEWIVIDKIKITSSHFGNVANYYSWLVISIIAPIIWFVAIPLLTNGRSLGMLICRIKIDLKKNLLERLFQLFKREIFTGLIISINLILILIVFDMNVFNKFTYFSKSKFNSMDDYVLPDGTKKHLTANDIFTSIDNLRISIVTTIASFMFITLLVFGISIIVRKQRLGFHDTFSNTKTFWENKTIELKEESEGKEITSFRPRLVKRENIEWIE